MDSRLQLFLICGTLFTFLFIIRMIQKRNLNIKYITIWLLSGIFLMILSLFPQIAVTMSYYAGIEVASNGVFLIMIVFLYMICFSYAVALSRNSERMKTIVQEVAMLKKNINDLRERELNN